MKLPNAERARVEREKILGYLLSPTHPDGSSKAEFFARFGFSMERWETLAGALRQHGASHPVVKAVESEHGVRYTVEGAVKSPDGRNPNIRTVWIIEEGETDPRLITAHPD